MSKLKKPTKVVLALCAVGMAVLAGWLVFHRISATQSLAQLRAQCMPVCIADLEPQTRAVDSPLVWTESVADAVIVADTKLGEPNFKFDDPVNDDLVSAFVKINEQFPHLLSSLQDMADAERLHPELDYGAPATQFIDSAIESSNHLRSIARVLRCRSRVLLADDQADEAASAALQILRISRAANELPGLTCFLTRSAVQSIALDQLNTVIQSNKLSPHVYSEIESELAKHDSLEEFKQALVTERAIGLSMIDEQGFAVKLLQLRGYLHLMEQEIDAAEKEAYQQAGKSSASSSSLAATVLPAISASRDVAMRQLAQVRALRVITALSRNGSESQVLDQIELPVDTKTDPITGDPLIVKRTKDGWSVYSVGRNTTDDGGQFDRDQDFGFGPTAK